MINIPAATAIVIKTFHDTGLASGFVSTLSAGIRDRYSYIEPLPAIVGSDSFKDFCMAEINSDTERK
jgi:hypothetical protein